MKLGYGNYGMPSTPYAEMVSQVAALGYDGVELCMGAAWPTSPANLDSADRKRLRGLLAAAILEASALLATGLKVFELDDAQHDATLAQVEQIVELGHDLGLEKPIVITTLGGRIEQWETLRYRLAERTADWAEVTAKCGATFAMEAHVGNIVDTPERTLWLLRTVDHPNLKINFDYSHFELLDIPLADAVAQLAPYAVATHVKDSKGRPPDFRFTLPGEGRLDYADYMRQLKAAGYDGYITVEISAQVFRSPGYDALDAAQRSYAVVASALERSGVNQNVSSVAATLQPTTGAFEVAAEVVKLPRGAYTKKHRLNVNWRGTPFCAFSEGPFRPYLFPLYTPSGYPVTTEIPLDHPHHNSLWIAMDRVRCALPFAQDKVEEAVYNFYMNEPFQGRAPGRIEVIETTWSAPEEDRLQVRQQLAWFGPREWGAENGRRVLRETRSWELIASEKAHIIDITSHLASTDWHLTLGPTRHAYFGIRLAEPLRVNAGGWLFDASGKQGGPAIAGTVSDWIAAGGNAGRGRQAGILLFPHPHTAGRPWDVNDWGTMTVNPFMDQAISLAPGDSFESALRLVVHDGPMQPDDAAVYYQSYLQHVGAWVEAAA